MKSLYLLLPVRGALVFAAVLQAMASTLMFVPLIALIVFTSASLSDLPLHAAPLIVAAVTGTLGAAVAGAAATWIAHRADAHLTWSLQCRLAEVIRRAPVPSVTGMGAGRIKKVVQDDTGSLHYLVAHTLVDVTALVITPLVGLAALFVIDWRFVLASALPLVLGILWYIRAMSGSGEKFGEYAATQERINTTVIDYVRGIPAAKVYGGIGGARARYLDAIHAFHDFFRGWSASTARSTTASWLVVAPGVTAAFLALVGGAGAAIGWVTGSSLLAAVLLGPMVAAPVALGGPRIQAVRAGLSALGSIDAMLQTPPLQWGRRRPESGTVRFEAVRHSFEGRVALRDIDFELPERGLFALVGPSGGGKSTVAGLIARFFDPSDGRVLVGGIDVRELSEEALYDRVGFVFQDTALRRASVLDNLTGGRHFPLSDVVGAARAAAVHDEILALPEGYDTVLGDDTELSGGQRQRVMLARALLRDARLLVLDETLSAVDSKTRIALLATLRSEAQQRAVLLITHQPRLVRHADRILVLDDGRLVGDGDHGTLSTHCDAYRSLQHTNSAANDWPSVETDPHAKGMR